MFYAYHTKYINGVGSPKLFFVSDFYSENYVIDNPILKTELGKAGSFSFVVPTSNVEYDNFDDLISYIDLYRVNNGARELLFSGRVFSHSKDFYNRLNVTCEGLFAVFNDSVQFPVQVTGITLRNLLSSFLTQHNSSVDDYKKVYLGNITVTDEYLTRLFENTVYTINRLNDVVESYGGYMSVRKNEEDGLLYLDYYAEYTEKSGQTINFGENLLDITQESNIDNFITVIVPYGARLTASDGSYYNVDISSVNGGKKYLENTELIKKYGRIVGTAEWPDVTQPSNLKTKALKYINSVSNSPSVTINVTAVDMAKANSDINYFKVGQNILIISQIHNIARYILATSQELHLLDPANNRMSLGDTYSGFISQTKNQANSNYSSIVNQSTILNDLSVRVENIATGGGVEPISDSEIDDMMNN